MDLNLERFRPMLSASLPCAKSQVPTEEEVIRDLANMDWERGFLASPKLDGIRCIKVPQHGLVTRTLTQIPNRFIQSCLDSPLFDHFDGELVIGKVDPETEQLTEFNDTQSGVMSQGGSPFFTYCIFDDIKGAQYRFDWRNEQAKKRIDTLQREVNFQGLFWIHHVEQSLCHTIEDLFEFEAHCISLGYEGIIFRDPGGRYKNGRSTYRQQGMLKLKRFIDAEAEIIGFEELERNTNTAEISALGYTKRSSAKSGQVAGNTLGKLLVRGINGRFKGVEFAIGSGFSQDLRDRIWRDRETYLGVYVKYKYQDAGSKNKPRSPIFLAFRHREDL